MDCLSQLVLFMYFGLKSLQGHHVLKVISFSTYFTLVSRFEFASICFPPDYLQTSDPKPCLTLVVPSCCPSVVLRLLQNQSSSQGVAWLSVLLHCSMCVFIFLFSHEAHISNSIDKGWHLFSLLDRVQGSKANLFPNSN